MTKLPQIFIFAIKNLATLFHRKVVRLTRFRYSVIWSLEELELLFDKVPEKRLAFKPVLGNKVISNTPRYFHAVQFVQAK